MPLMLSSPSSAILHASMAAAAPGPGSEADTGVIAGSIGRAVEEGDDVALIEGDGGPEGVGGRLAVTEGLALSPPVTVAWPLALAAGDCATGDPPWPVMP